MKPGVRVSHPAFGVGIVSAVNLTGAARRAHVDFGYTQAWIVLDVLEVLQEESAAAPVSTQTELEAQAPSRPAEEDVEQTFDAADVDIAWSTTPTLPKSQTEARKGIAALRLGQILQSQALQLSVGTETLQRRLREALSRALAGKPTFILIDGAWGGGKTHALTLLQSLAREQKMTTSGAVMDGVAVTLSEPTRLMEAIVGSIRVSGDGSDDGIGHLLRMAKLQGRSPSLRARGAREVADALDSFPPRAFDDPEALQCIEDYFSFALSATQVRAKLRQLDYDLVSPPALITRWVDQRPQAFAVLLRCWAQTLAVMGAHGLVVVLDELDVEYASTAYADRASWGRRARRRALLERLENMSAAQCPLLIAFASAPAGPGVGSEDDAVEDVREAFGSRLIHLKAPNPSEEDLKQLLATLTSLYETAYPDKTLGLVARRATSLFGGLYASYRRSPNPVPRHFVRTALEAFDLLTVGEQSFDDLMKLLKGSG